MTTPESAPAPAQTDDRRFIWLVLIALVAAWSLFLYYFQPGAPDRQRLDLPRLAPPTGANSIAYDWPLVDLKGRPVDFARYRGKTLFLNIWATWCPPCVAEMPSIANLAADPRLGENVAVLCVSTDEDPASVERFLESRKLDLPVALAASAPPPALQTEGIPASFVIGPDGTVLAQDLGAARWDDPSVIDRLRALAGSREPE